MADGTDEDGARVWADTPRNDRQIGLRCCKKRCQETVERVAPRAYLSYFFSSYLFFVRGTHIPGLAHSAPLISYVVADGWFPSLVISTLSLHYISLRDERRLSRAIDK
jgi:hypothetical protein